MDTVKDGRLVARGPTLSIPMRVIGPDKAWVRFSVIHISIDSLTRDEMRQVLAWLSAPAEAREPVPGIDVPIF